VGLEGRYGLVVGQEYVQYMKIITLWTVNRSMEATSVSGDRRPYRVRFWRKKKMPEARKQ
jgi:hypothetical protein